MRGCVVAAEHPVRPAAGRQRRLVVGDDPGEGCRVPWRLEQLEVERQVHARRGSAAVVGHQPVERQEDLADQQPLAVLVGQLAEGVGDLVDFGLIGRMVLQHLELFAHAGGEGRIGRIIAQVLGLDAVPQHVDAEAVDAAIEPEAQHAGHRGADVGVAPVEVGLLLEERVQVILAGRGSNSQAEPPMSLVQLLGGAVPHPRQAPDRARCTSRAWGCRATSGFRRNQGCWTEVWLGTKSSISFRPRRCASASKASN